MDKNTSKILKAVNYKLVDCCGLCKFASFISENEWGTCQKFLYDHEKHTEAEREMSIHKLGSCVSFERSLSIPLNLLFFEKRINE